MAEPLTGKELGGCRILDKLGEGGMGVAYKAHHTRLDRVVVVKVLHAVLAADKEYIESFEREARAAAKLEHPRIVQVYDQGNAGGLYYIVMQFIDGEDLEANMKRVGRLVPLKAVPIVKAAFEGLGEAHRQGIVHRDVKPSNILLGKDGTIRLSDFGLAVQARQSTDNMVYGTPMYMAPEQAWGAKVDHRADIYAMGVTLYHMLAGKVPYDLRTAGDVRALPLDVAVPDVRQVNPEVSRLAAQVIAKMMAKRPDARHQSVPEVLQDLDSPGVVFEEGSIEGERVIDLGEIQRSPSAPIPSPEIDVTPKPPAGAKAEPGAQPPPGAAPPAQPQAPPSKSKAPSPLPIPAPVPQQPAKVPEPEEVAEAKPEEPEEREVPEPTTRGARWRRALIGTALVLLGGAVAYGGGFWGGALMALVGLASAGAALVVARGPGPLTGLVLLIGIMSLHVAGRFGMGMEALLDPVGWKLQLMPIAAYCLGYGMWLSLRSQDHEADTPGMFVISVVMIACLYVCATPLDLPWAVVMKRLLGEQEVVPLAAAALGAMVLAVLAFRFCDRRGAGRLLPLPLLLCAALAMYGASAIRSHAPGAGLRKEVVVRAVKAPANRLVNRLTRGQGELPLGTLALVLGVLPFWIHRPESRET